VRLAVTLLAIINTALGCTVVPYPVKQAAKRADLVFRGSIEQIREAEIVFRVHRVWKGQVSQTIALPKIVWTSTPCMIGFYSAHVRVGAELLVYARRMPELNVAGYVPEPGSRTALIRDADDDLNKLGKGRTPKHH